MGLIEEGDEVIANGKGKDDALADLVLICAGLRVEHYEIAAYTTARNLALQLREPLVVQLLTTSLGEEQNAGQLLDQVAQPFCPCQKCRPASNSECGGALSERPARRTTGGGATAVWTRPL